MNLLKLWAGEALKKERKRLNDLECNYNTLSGINTSYVFTHDKMIEARRKVVKIWESVIAAEIKREEHSNKTQQTKVTTCLVCGGHKWVNGPGDNHMVACSKCNPDGKQ